MFWRYQSFDSDDIEMSFNKGKDKHSTELSISGQLEGKMPLNFDKRQDYLQKYFDKASGNVS